MMLDGPELPPILTTGVPWKDQVRLLSSAVFCGLFMGLGVVNCFDGKWALGLLELAASLALQIYARRQQKRYFDAKYAAIRAVFDELARRHDANRKP